MHFVSKGAYKTNDVTKLEVTRFSFRRTSSASPLGIGWRVRVLTRTCTFT